MQCPSLQELPPPPPGRSGWPWTVESPRLTAARPGGGSWPRISIVTPSLNQASYLEETIRSILLQGYPELEYVVIDGASSDSSLEIIRKYEPWLSWVSEADRGQSHAINKGFERCSGELLTFQNSDDLYLPGAFADVGLRWPLPAECGGIVGGFFYIDGTRMRAEPIPARLPHRGPIDLAITPAEGWRLHQVSTFYRSAALDQVGRWVREDLHYTMDRELLYRVCRRFAVILSERPYGAFRWHDRGKSVSNFLRADLEYADLHLSYHYDSRAAERMKRKVAAYRRAKGYLRFALHSGDPGRAIVALLRAPIYRPDLVLRASYLKSWLRILRIGPLWGGAR
jgi:glycosyltransferase involved in cell wall biosynthesis